MSRSENKDENKERMRKSPKCAVQNNNRHSLVLMVLDWLRNEMRNHLEAMSVLMYSGLTRKKINLLEFYLWSTAIHISTDNVCRRSQLP
jgi:hypothetical protein